MRSRHAAATAFAGAIVALALTAVPAFAAATVHFDEPESCFDDGYGTTTCTSSTGQYNTTITPNGQEHLTGKGTTTYRVVSPTSTLYDTRDYNINFYFKDGDVHVFKQRSTETFVIDGRTCTVTIQYHLANGSIQFDRPETVCDPA
jgi:hypothetical protein